MRWSRTKLADKVSVIESKINNPDITLSEIRKETWLPTSTIDDIIKKDLPEVRKGSEIITQMIDSNNNIIAIWKKLIETYLPALKVNRYDDLKKISEIIDTSFKQNQLVWWEATDRNEIIFKIKE